MSLTLEHARKYILNGWSVFPIPSKKKKPVIEWGPYQERYATDEELNKWFATGNNSVGIATGKLSNLTVFDADGERGLALIREHNLSSIGTVITGGGGRQLFYKWNGETNKQESVDHEGKDLRGEGGYVVAPPSLHESGMRYRWAQTIPNGRQLKDFPKGIFPDVNVQVQTTTLPQESEYQSLLLGASKGSRHRHLIKLACYLIPRHSYSMVKQLLLEWNMKNSPPIGEDEVVKQLNDLVGRFTKGQYKSAFKAPQEETPNVTSEQLEISTPSTDADNYITRVCTTPAPPELPTGFSSLDEVTWGIHRGDIFTIGARPGTGKTSFAINVASGLCKAGKRVLYFSTEMSKDELYNAISSSQGNVDAFRLSNKQLNDEDKRQLTQFIPELKKYDIHHVKFFTPDQQAVADAVEQIKPDLLVIDHLQHIASGNNKYEQIDKFVKFLKKLAMEKNIAVLCSSQLKRKEDGLMPEMSDLKECGTIEEESSVVILLHSTSRDVTRPVLFRLAKNRHGKCGDTTLLFDATITKFADMAQKVS